MTTLVREQVSDEEWDLRQHQFGFRVAMTRAKQSLSLVSPLRFHVTQQPPTGDKHVYGARSRFVSERLMDTMHECFRGRPEAGIPNLRPRSGTRIDVAAKMREMW